jgi:hypothetical protein
MKNRGRLVAYVGSLAMGVGVLAGLARALGAGGDRTAEAGLFGALAGYGLVTLIIGLRGLE